MLITIKPHSSFQNLFTSDRLLVDVVTYYDIIFYLNSLQPKFFEYTKKQASLGINESFVLLDKRLRIINSDELQIRRAKEDDIIYIVPAIIGGGGKRGGLLAILALGAFLFLPLGAAAAGAGAAAPIGAAVSGAGGVGGAIAGLAKSGGFLQNLVVNIGLSFLSSLFASNPKENQTRANDMFGSLTNSTSSGTPVALNYGMVRVAGQLISGYIQSSKHGKNSQVNAYGDLLLEKTTAESQQEADRAAFLKGFNQYG